MPTVEPKVYEDALTIAGDVGPATFRASLHIAQQCLLGWSFWKDGKLHSFGEGVDWLRKHIFLVRVKPWSPPARARLPDFGAYSARDAYKALVTHDPGMLAMSLSTVYGAQIADGAQHLPNEGELAKRYCAGLFHDSALYYFSDKPSRHFLKRFDFVRVL